KVVLPPAAAPPCRYLTNTRRVSTVLLSVPGFLVVAPLLRPQFRMVKTSITGSNHGWRAALRRFATAIIFGLFLVGGIGTDITPAEAQNGVVTFRFTNLARHTIFIRMFSVDRRGIVWPPPGQHFIFNDRLPRDARLACVVGEQICFGGGYNTRDTSSTWGV